MQVILCEKIRNLGNLGDTVNVKAGYARNFLVPKAKAVFATKENIATFQARKAALEQAAAEILKAAQVRAEKINGLGTITLSALASEEGKLFGSISVREISDAVTAAGAVIEKNEVDMPLGPIHNVGEYDVDILLHTDVVAKVHVVIVAQE
jgi:large subunit ribosomal protein L9